MFYEYSDPKLRSIFGLTDHLQADEHKFSIQKGLVKILWNRNQESVDFYIDDIPIEFQPQQIVTLTFLQHLTIEQNSPPLTAYLFNREFYCILDHDYEVSCNGIIFFGTQDIPVITLPEGEQKKFDMLHQVFQDEFQTRDNIQGEMLQMLLKRLIIKCTRLTKEQRIVKELDNRQVDTIRQFNLLVDMHYKEKKQVSEYAEMLYKSPKTLANLFATYNQKSPLRIIHERIVLEAKRLLYFTDKSSKEISWDLGFEDLAHFSKLFKKVTGETPTDYKQKKPLAQLGKNRQPIGKT